MPSAVLSGRTALVVGGASGIGRATAERFREAGLRVLVGDLPETDVRSRESVQALYQRTSDELGIPDVVVTTVGVGVHERLDEGDPEKWAQAIEVGLIGALRVARAFVPGMTGDFVFLGSVASDRPYEYGGAYGAAKAGLATAVETLRMELGGRVRTTIVSPGSVRTEFFASSLGGARPLPEDLLDPEDVADAIIFAISRPAHVALNEIVIRPRAQRF